jgi:hypothetical protein
MAIVWPCTQSVDANSAAGTQVEVPRADCPDCSQPMEFWWGYSRFVRHLGRCFEIWIRRGHCERCATTHALLPAFCALNRLDSIETIGEVLQSAGAGVCGARPAAERLRVPHTTARGWVRRFSRHAMRIAVAFAALGVELGGKVLTPVGDPRRSALDAIAESWRAATSLPGWLGAGPWRFASCVCGGTLICANTNSPWLVVGRRRFMPPVP